MSNLAIKDNRLERTKDAEGFSWYPSPGPESYLSVTTIIEHGAPTPLALKNWMKRNTEAHIEKTLTKTAAQGTAFHKIAESSLRGETIVVPGAFKEHTEAFLKWRDEHQVKPFQNEVTLYSHQYGFAGTADLIAEVDGKPSVIDFKTSNSFKKEKYARQLGAYRLAAIEMELLPPDGGMICVQVGRDTAKLQQFVYQHFESCENAFLHALENLKFDAFYKLKALGWKWLEQPIFERKAS